jgi:heme A synthase
MKKRWLLIIIVALIGITSLFIGIRLEQAAFIHQQSTSL